jgi:hypothetical protein
VTALDLAVIAMAPALDLEAEAKWDKLQLFGLLEALRQSFH